MKPCGWAVCGALGASVGWLLVVAYVLDQVADLGRQLAWARRGREDAWLMVRETLAQSTRMAHLATAPPGDVDTQVEVQ